MKPLRYYSSGCCRTKKTFSDGTKGCYFERSVPQMRHRFGLLQLHHIELHSYIVKGKKKSTDSDPHSSTITIIQFFVTQRISSPKDKNSLIVYSPSCQPKLTFFSWRQTKIFTRSHCCRSRETEEGQNVQTAIKTFIHIAPVYSWKIIVLFSVGICFGPWKWQYV